ncbi:hypothetical protein K439DRAFT_43173 [Ramaria rubella]|nr:hypothetical protein K439DRAFT_43173 [Ramaria rubella]
MLEWEEMKKAGHITQAKSKPSFKLGEHALIHRIAYTESGILIYGFFPRVLKFSEDGTPVKWGFGCVNVGRSFDSVFERRTREIRMELIKTLLTVQRHATRLAEAFRNLKLHDEFSICDEIWRNGKLGRN